MDATWSRVAGGSEWDLAVELANRVAAGDELPNLASPVLLDTNEVLHADITAQGWRFHAVDVSYTAPRAVAIGGPVIFGLVAASSAVARRRARREAEAVAAPQWRPLGGLRVLATDRRLLVWHEATWASVWYDAIRELRPDLEVGRLDVTFENDPPYCLAGPWVPYLAVVLTSTLARRLGVNPVRHTVEANMV
ncbi:MAG: hypothetical protein M5T61_19325 [Acidimicrobiia bacterium]|nr:hypothetical protein [Acidimicrobiia bacterium]